MKRIYVDANPREGAYLVEGEQPRRIVFGVASQALKHDVPVYLPAPYCELEAILKALEEQSDGEEVEILSDSQTAIYCLNLDYAIHKKELREKCYQIWNLIREKKLKVTWTWLDRKVNKAGKVLG